MTTDEPDDLNARLLAILEKHAIQIMEHCDSVQIVVTRFDPITDETFTLRQGKGNFYARVASVADWLKETE
jgi:hypothetical protein